MEPILNIRNLTVTIAGRRVVDDVSLELYPGKVTAIVGESGSGKTLTALSLLDLLPQSSVKEKGEVFFRGKDIFSLEKEEMRQLRGKHIAMVFQEPFTALNPVMRISEQISESIVTHEKTASAKVSARVKDLLDMVKLGPEILKKYPHELSGGMRQRVVMAIALACGPEVLILDEPTTALDVSIQKDILDLVMRIQQERQFSILFITHDFSIVNLLADEVCVMKEGKIVEKGEKDNVLRKPQHEYTRKLIDCIPRLGDKRERLPG